jgi:N-acetyl-anhydromuramyl-L-alanine amidase AmpD
MQGDRGVFTISLDTELSWGTFDVGRIDEYEYAYRQTRHVVDRICNIFDKYEITATWAVVAHLLDDCTVNHDTDPRPSYEWTEEWYTKLPCVTDVDR